MMLLLPLMMLQLHFYNLDEPEPEHLSKKSKSVNANLTISGEPKNPIYLWTQASFSWYFSTFCQESESKHHNCLQNEISDYIVNTIHTVPPTIEDILADLYPNLSPLLPMTVDTVALSIISLGLQSILYS